MGGIVMTLGTVITAGAVLWWHSFWTGVSAFFSGGGGAPVECLYALSGECRMASKVASLAGTNAYEPSIFWAGLGLVGAGLVLALRSKNACPVLSGYDGAVP